jgi:hypothetical protein
MLDLDRTLDDWAIPDQTRTDRGAFMSHESPDQTGPMEFWDGGGDGNTGEVVNPHANPDPEPPPFLDGEPPTDGLVDGYPPPDFYPGQGEEL